MYAKEKCNSEESSRYQLIQNQSQLLFFGNFLTFVPFIHCRIKQYVNTGIHCRVKDPTPDQKWIKLKNQGKKATVTQTNTDKKTDGIVSSSQAETCYKGVYNKSKVILNWSKDLKDFPLFTQHEIIAHRNKSGKRKIDGDSDHPIVKTTSRGEHFKNERYIDADTIFCSINESFCYVKGICQASKRSKKRYNKSVALQKTSGNVEYANCECPQGTAGFCSHVMAMLTELAEYSLLQLRTIPEEISCTSRAREWGIPRTFSGKMYKSAIMDMAVNKMKVDQYKNPKLGVESTLYEARAGNSKHIDHVAVQQLKSKLSNIDPHIGFACTITPDNDNTKYVRTKFGPSPVGSVLSYQVSITEENVKVYCDLSVIPEAKANFECQAFPLFPLQNIPVFGYIDETSLNPEKVEILKN